MREQENHIDLDACIDELIALGYLRYAEPDKLQQNTIAAWNRRVEG